MKEIGDWFTETCLKFAQQENTNPCRSASEFLKNHLLKHAQFKGISPSHSTKRRKPLKNKQQLNSTQVIFPQKGTKVVSIRLDYCGRHPNSASK